VSGWWHAAIALWWGSIAPLAVQATLLILAVAFVDRLLPKRTWPQLRAALWYLAMLKLVLPPGLISPLSVVRWVPRGWSVDTVPAVLEAGSAVDPVGFAGAIVALWLAGGLTLTLFSAYRMQRMRRGWSAAGHEPTPVWLLELSFAAANRVGLRRPPGLILSRSVRAPFVDGLLRPHIYLPHDLHQRIPRDQLEHVLLHELAHVKRRDPWFAAACLAIQLTYWFHPLVWLAARRLSVLREQCCDRSVARVLRDSTVDYRRTLLEFASRMVDDASAGRLGFIRPETLILARLRLLEHGGQERRWLRRGVTTVVIAAGLVGFFPVARSANAAVGAVADRITRPPGCLQLRYTVLQKLAQQRSKAGDQPRTNQEERIDEAMER